MNTPARFESLLWLASPMMDWAQSSPVPGPQADIEPAPGLAEASLPLEMAVPHAA
jgi:hypothetical protein